MEEIRQQIDAEQATNLKVNQIDKDALIGVLKRKHDVQSSSSSKCNGKKPRQNNDQK